MTLSAQQYVSMRALFRSALAANSYLYANPSDGEVLSFYRQLVTEASGAAALATAQQSAIGYAFRGILSGNFSGVSNPNDGQVLDFWTQIGTDSVGAAALSVPRYQALKQTLLDVVALNYPGAANPSLLQLLGYFEAVGGGFNGNFASLFPDAYQSVQSDLGLAPDGSSWADQSANGKSYTIGSGAPLVTATGPNGYAGVLLDGVDDLLVSSLNLPAPGTAAFLLLMVARNVTWQGGGRWVGGVGADPVCVVYNSGGSPAIRANNTSDSSIGSPVVGTWTVFEVLWSNSAADYLRVGAAAAAAGFSMGNSSTTGRCIGGSGGFFAKIEVAQLAYVPNQSTAAYRLAVASKYGIAV